MNAVHTQAPARDALDARGPRFAAILTTVVLALALVFLATPLGGVLLAWQTLAFAIGAIAGVSAQPYAAIYRRFVRPRLGPPTKWEDPAPPRFAQSVGLVFAAVALVSWLLGWDIAALVATGAALAAAFLNAAFGLCLGCEMYLLGRRVIGRATA